MLRRYSPSGLATDKFVEKAGLWCSHQHGAAEKLREHDVTEIRRWGIIGASGRLGMDHLA